MEHVYPILANLALGISAGALVATLWLEIKSRRNQTCGTITFLWTNKYSLVWDGEHWFVTSGVGGHLVGGLHYSPTDALKAAGLEKENATGN